MYATRQVGSAARRSRLVFIAVAAVLFAAGAAVANAVETGSASPIQYSTTTDHSSSQDLERATKVHGQIYVFLTTAATQGATRVDYYIDNAAGEGKPVVTSTKAPFDISSAGWNTTKLSKGQHTLLAVITVAGNNVPNDVFARFTVDNSSTNGSGGTGGSAGGTSTPPKNNPGTSSGTGGSGTSGTGSGTGTGSTGGTGTGNAAGGTGAGSGETVGKAQAAFNWGTPTISDEFNDLKNWHVYDNGGKVDFGYKDKANVTTAGGMLTIHGKTDGHTGGMAMQHNHVHMREELRSKAVGTGECWRPVRMLWADNGGEIDFGESGGQLTKSVSAFFHQNGGQTSGNATVNENEWHDYAVDWSANGITAYLDGKAFHTDKNGLKNPMHPVLQLDSHGSGEACKGSDVVWTVDWLRVWDIN